MNRPYIFCHMMTALDGKIMGSYMETPQGSAAGNVFYDIAFGKEPFYHHQGWLSGRVTTDDTPPVFRARKGLSENKALGFTLKEAKVMDGGAVWLRYTVNQ